MLKVALTGGVASGKSTVAAMIREAGLPVLDSDAMARQAVAPGKPAWQALRQNSARSSFCRTVQWTARHWPVMSLPGLKPVRNSTNSCTPGLLANYKSDWRSYNPGESHWW